MGLPRRVAGGPGPDGCLVGAVFHRVGNRGRGRRVRGCRGWRSARRRLVRAPLRRRLDTSGRDPLPSGHRRSEPHHADAHFHRGDPRAACLLDHRQASDRLLPLPTHVGGGLSVRRVHGARPVPVLLLLRDDARAVLLPGRPVGARAAPAGGHQVLHLHAGRRTSHAHLNRGPVLRARTAIGGLHLRLPATARHNVLRVHRAADHAGFLCRLRREAARRTAARVAPGRPF